MWCTAADHSSLFTRNICELLDLGRDDAVLTPGPIGHVSGLQLGFIIPVVGGMRCTVLMDGWDARRAFRHLIDESITYCLVMSAGLATMLEFARRSGSAYGRLPLKVMVFSTAPAEPKLVEEAAAIGWPIVRGYGMSEHPGVSISPPNADLDRGFRDRRQASPRPAGCDHGRPGHPHRDGWRRRALHERDRPLPGIRPRAG